MDLDEKKLDVDPVIKVQSKEGEIIELPLWLARKLDPIANWYDCSGTSDNNSQVDGSTFCLNFSSESLKTIVEWATYHKDDPESSDEEEDVMLPEEDLGQDMDNLRGSGTPKWDRDFCCNIDDDVALDVLSACHFLQFKRMLRLMVKFFASYIAGESVEFARTKLRIVNDYTPEEEAELKKVNSWAEIEDDFDRTDAIKPDGEKVNYWSEMFGNLFLKGSL